MYVKRKKPPVNKIELIQYWKGIIDLGARELIVDNFAGGGGASTGIEQATGCSVDYAINHDPDAIAMHKANHPDTIHFCESVWDIDPRDISQGRPVGLVWLSPDCKHFSKAKGSKPVEKSIRGLAWVAIRWAATARPRVIMLENVEEFKTWGPIIPDDEGNFYPDPKQKGRTFKSFINALMAQGYEVEWKEMRACDYGAPTIRKRFFLVARCDGLPIVFPEPVLGDPDGPQVNANKLLPWHDVSEVIDWTIPAKSIFGRKKDLVPNTQRRIGLGTWKWVINDSNPFIAPVPFDADNNNSELVSAFLIQYHSYGDGVRGQALTQPLLTIDTSNRYGLVTAHMMKMKGTNIGQAMDTPLHTITAGGIHFGVVQCFLIQYNGASIGQDLNRPLGTVPTHDRFGLVMVHGTPYQIYDIRLRMLVPRELFGAQGFPEEYIIDQDHEGKPYPISKQVARCGNSVSPPMSKALVKANLPHMCTGSGKVLAFHRYDPAVKANGQLELSI
ncbi:DNA cytosine methyltransferase [Paenibacillus psychroresistens]|uniref:DNA (cytosine-5-)-methyltransferase n=2 Tax=Paenibacillus psychroresistens TaxID=1778678 RepID=A0A6B8RWA5_9BACL|nr:DNA cytosine methyltransferase [Paenibacillus psychroresistens]